MDFFLDTAFTHELEQAVAWGLCDGVTTNPSLIARTGETFEALAPKILKIVKGPVSLEVISDDHEGMVKEAKKLRKIAKNVVVKIPMTQEGMKAVKILAGEGIKTNATLVFTAIQALIAAKAGATYISPFIGRLDDINHEGLDVIADIREVFDNYGVQTKIIAASIRHPLHVLECAKIGADVCTIPFKTMQQLFRHPLTDKGIELFKADYAKIPKPKKTRKAAPKKKARK